MIPIETKLKTIREALDMAIADDIDSIIGKGVTLSGLIGLSAETKAQAKKLLELARLRAFNEMQGKDLPPSTFNKVIDMHCSEELGIYEYADRLNAGITHEIDILRSILSYRKEEMRNELNNIG